MATTARRAARRRNGLPNWRVVRYADDFAVLVHGGRQDAEALREDIAHVLATMGLRFSEAKTRVVHVSEGLSFVGFRVQWRRKRGTEKWYAFIDHRPIRSLKAKIRALTRRTSQQDLGHVYDQAPPGHTRLGQLLQARRGQEHVHHAGQLRLVASHPHAAGPAPLEMEGRPPEARCVERRTAGSARGPGKRTGSNPGTAPRAYSAAQPAGLSGVLVLYQVSVRGMPSPGCHTGQSALQSRRDSRGGLDPKRRRGAAGLS